MTSRKYWQQRYLQIAAANQRHSIQYEQQMLDQVDAIYTALSTQIASWYKRYGRTKGTDFAGAAAALKDARNEGWQMTLTEFERKARLDGYDDELDLEYIRSRVARLQQLQAQLVSSVAPVVPEIQDSMSAEMQARYKYTYEHAMYLTEALSGVTGNFASYSEDQLKMVVAQPWHGSNFSQRVWGTLTNSLPDLLMHSLAEAVVLGYAPGKVASKLADKYGAFKAVDLHRLINTEMAHIAEQATLKSYSDCDVEYYQYMATLESHTCSTCAALDGRIIKMQDRIEGGNYPPIHPYCRCTTGAYFKNMPEPGERWSRDPVTGRGKRVPMQSFNQWISKQHK
mgnify:CR=1 FL=1